jgi:polygalacturonase
MKSRYLNPLLSILFAWLPLASIAIPTTPQHTSDGRLWGGDPIAPLNAPFPMADLQRPEVPDRSFDIRDHGAQAGGLFDNTQAIRNTIATLRDAGGGTVVVPAGLWFTGPIHFVSNMELHLEEGAELIFNDDPDAYLPVVKVRGGGIEFYNYSPLIYGKDLENVAITGPGKLNGNAERWWDWKHKETNEIFSLEPRGIPVEQRIFGTVEAAIRPSFVVFMDCKNVLMEGFTIGSGPNWTLHPIYCENVIIRRVLVLTDGPNNDGIDPDSVRNLLVEYCVFDTGDDCMVLKSGYNEDGWRVAKPTENVVMRWCSSKRGHGGLVIGSEMSGDVRNVYMHDCDFEGTDRAVRVKSRRGRGGVVENIWVRDIRVKDMQAEVAMFNMQYGADRAQLTNEKPPIFRNIHIQNIEADGAPCAVRFLGLPDGIIENITISDSNIRSREGVVCDHASGVHLSNLHLITSDGPALDIKNTQGLRVTNLSIPQDATHPLLIVRDGASNGIQIN